MSSYDVIETLVTVKLKYMTPALIIQKEGEIQFTKYLPLEQGTRVQPKFDKLCHYVESVERCASKMQSDFVRCGYFLNLIRRESLYRYCVDEGQQGYTNFYRFCEDKIGVSQKTAQRLISINEHFCGNDFELPIQYQKFGSSKLAIMATFKNGLEGKLDPSVTVRDLQKLHKYYASVDWKVDLHTTWRQDLRKFEEEKQDKVKAKNRYLHVNKFRSAKEEDEKPMKLVSNPYKATTRFFDQTLESLNELENGKNKKFQPIYDELKNVLRRMQSEVLRMQGEEMTKGL